MKNEPTPDIDAQLTAVVATLRDNGHAEAAGELESLGRKLHLDAHSQLEAAAEISGMCHIRRLGDLYVKSPEYKRWLGMLNALRAAVSVSATRQ
jgi:hypothetical protein